MKTQAIVLVVIACLISGLYGCTTATSQGNVSKSGALLEPSGTLKFSDVPVPSGFKSLPQASYSFEAAGVRVGVLKYQGKADPDQVVNFYKEQMPMYNWNLLNVVEYGERILNFDRENETCIVNLLAKGRVVTITVSLGPKSQIVPKKSKEPIK